MLLAFRSADGDIVAVADVIADLFAAGIWHVGFFMAADRLHGSGVPRALYAHLEGWMRAQGARWLRLAVVRGNARAERFWTRHGYVETRLRHGVAMGARVNTVRVMMKPLEGGDLAGYLALVERDRPDP
jgi:GNAT superfamily N-acetyltransferase